MRFPTRLVFLGTVVILSLAVSFFSLYSALHDGKDAQLRPPMQEVSAQENKTPSLEEVVGRVGGASRSVIMISATSDYSDLVDNWASSVAKAGYGSRIVFVAQDEESYRHLEARWRGQCVYPEKDKAAVGDKGDAGFNTPFFNSVVHHKPKDLLRMLLLNVSVLLSDVDMVWRGDPFAYFTGDYDLWVQEDTKPDADMDKSFARFVDGAAKPAGEFELEGGNHVQLCTCFMMVRPTPAALQLVHKWLDVIGRFTTGELESPYRDDQTAFNLAWKEVHGSVRLGVLPITSFPSGCLLFGGGSCHNAHSAYEEVQLKWNVTPAVVHANWLIGRMAKVAALKSIGAWQGP